ncbi:MAG: nicotinate (nicotinamide) nucleotide adenylyltransferase [Anaerolineales bacterium]|nr:nicotinate (nicotinamide) nucleotide adenylyltransferase [Chloroflexota bacterium]MBL6982221.1 nicotinate (nicotinamide) nucleotide adenylyltransferase [Anaerolineales bacterium]
MRLGIFGGTFDPPHIAHLTLAEHALSNLDLDQVLWVLTSHPPHKRGQPITPLKYRLEMLQIAISDNPKFILSRVDIDRPPPHYALETVRLLREENPKVELIYLMGGDSLRDLDTWHKPVDFVSACDALGVICRPGVEINLEDLESIIPGITPKVQFVEAPLLEISASDIRKRIREGHPFSNLLPPAVHQIIQKKQLYHSQ